MIFTDIKHSPAGITTANSDLDKGTSATADPALATCDAKLLGSAGENALSRVEADAGKAANELLAAIGRAGKKVTGTIDGAATAYSDLETDNLTLAGSITTLLLER